MTKECTLKEAFIASKLDEIQPDWKEGKVVTQDTKLKIHGYVQEKYGDFLEEARCISIRSIEKTITRLRNKLKIPAPRTVKEFPESIQNTTNPELQNNVNQPIRDGSADKIEDDQPENTPEVCDGSVCLDESTLEPNQTEEPATENPELQIQPEEPQPAVTEDTGNQAYKADCEICPGCGYAYEKVSKKWLSPADVEALRKENAEGDR